MLEILDREYNSTRSLASAGRLKENFGIEMMKKDDTLSSYIARLIQYKTELAHTRFAISDDDITFKLLSGLPKEWQHVKEVIYNTGEFTWQNAVSVLHNNKAMIGQLSIGNSH